MAGMGPAVLIDPDHPHIIEAGRPGGGEQFGGARHGDRVDRVPGSAQLPGHRSHGGPVDDQTPQHVPGAPTSGRRPRPRQQGRVLGEDHPLAAGPRATVARDPHPQLQRMPGDRQVGQPPLDAVAVGPDRPAARTTLRTPADQLAPHHRRLAVHSGAGDRDPEFDGTDDRVGQDRRGRERRLRHRAPGGC